VIDQVEHLRAALAAEHAALYAYGRLGVLLEKEIRPVAHEAEGAHRARRDALIVHLDRIKAQPVEAQTAYALPFAVTDRESALRLAAKVEEGVAATWHSALASTSPTASPATDPRRLALDGLSDAAVRATRWRKIAAVTPLTSVFPGRPV
jgi:hypothetical protein